MSWDVIIFNTCGKTPTSLEHFEESDYEPLGTAAEVRQRLSAVLPEIDWTDEGGGLYKGDGLSIEFNIGGVEVVRTMSLEVRGWPGPRGRAAKPQDAVIKRSAG